jgi:hypothetical protein
LHLIPESLRSCSDGFADGCGFSIVIERAGHVALVREQDGKREADSGQRLLCLRIVVRYRISCPRAVAILSPGALPIGCDRA